MKSCDGQLICTYFSAILSQWLWLGCVFSVKTWWEVLLFDCILSVPVGMVLVFVAGIIDGL